MSLGKKLHRASSEEVGVPEPHGRCRIVLPPSAAIDIREVLIWTKERFGERAAARYRDLLKQALRDIAADPGRPGSKERPDLARGIRTYRIHAASDLGVVRKPRH